MTANFNRVVELADTEFVALLYDDDLFYPDYLQHTVEALERSSRRRLRAHCF